MLPTGFRIAEIDAEATHPLRRSVLRTGTPSTELRWSGDDDPSTCHLAVLDDDGRVIAISSWLAAPCPHRPGDPSVQLRGMAVAPEHRAGGLGGALLRAGLDHSAGSGARVAWARSRVRAVGLYLRHGFETVGDEYVDGTTGLPHVDVVIGLDRDDT